jgi:hypothetical protein
MIMCARHVRTIVAANLKKLVGSVAVSYEVLEGDFITIKIGDNSFGRVVQKVLWKYAGARLHHVELVVC